MSLDYYRHAAPRDVVFVHGAGGTNLLWKRVIDGFEGTGTAFAINLPGHPSGEISCKSIDEYAEAVYQFVSSIGIRRPVLCGHSMGGAIALTFALAYPDDISNLVLVSTGAKLGVQSSIRDGLAENPLRTIEISITPMSFYKPELSLLRESRATLSIPNPAVFLNDYNACNAFDARERVPEVRSRTLIICGEFDRMTPPRWSHYLNARIPNSSAFFIRDAGHMVPLERPTACRRLISDHLA